MNDSAKEYWHDNANKLSINPKGNSEIDTRIRRELEALAHQIVEFSWNPYEDPLVPVAYAIARALNLPGWSAAEHEADEMQLAAIESIGIADSEITRIRNIPEQGAKHNG